MAFPYPFMYLTLSALKLLAAHGVDWYFGFELSASYF